MSEPALPEAVDEAVDEAGDLRAAQRTLTLFGVAVVAVVLGVLSVLLGRNDSDPSTLSADGEAVDVATPGPDQGEGVETFIARRREALVQAEGRQGAVVSFDQYLRESEAAAVVGDEAEVLAFLVALPGDVPRVAESAEAARREAIDEAETQLAEIEPLVPTVDDPEFADFYRSELIRYRQVVDAVGREDIVFGVVVRGRSADLRAIAARAKVRVVDPGPVVSLGGALAGAGLRPEEVVSAGSPRFRP